MKEHVIAFIAGVIFTGFGMACIFWPEKVRGYYLNSYSTGLSYVKRHDLSYLKKFFPSVLVFRIVGVICLIISLLIFYVLINK
jgi:hypothetical protein